MGKGLSRSKEGQPMHEGGKKPEESLWWLLGSIKYVTTASFPLEKALGNEVFHIVLESLMYSVRAVRVYLNVQLCTLAMDN